VKIIINADTEVKRIKGLMHHRPITKKECAFFTMARCGQHSFWNKNVSFPISLIFCNANKEVKEIKTLQAHQTDFVKSDSSDILYIVEAHFSYPQENKVKPGSIMQIKDGEVSFR